MIISLINQNAYYYNSAIALTTLLKDKEIVKKKIEFSKNNLKRRYNVYKWSIVVNQYESYFKRILDNK